MTAAKKTSARSRKPAQPETARDEHHTTEQTDAPADQRTDTVEFQGRTIRVNLPSPEQIVVFRRMMEQLEERRIRAMTGQQVMATLGRVRNMIDSIMVDSTDVDWLDDEMLAKRVTLIEAAKGILVEAIQKLANRSQRRAAAKASPARRKKAA